jgi:hypothetical protein
MREVKEMSGEARVEAKMAEVEERIEEMRELVIYVAAAWLSPEVRRGREKKSAKSFLIIFRRKSANISVSKEAYKCFVRKATLGRETHPTYRDIDPDFQQKLRKDSYRSANYRIA